MPATGLRSAVHRQALLHLLRQPATVSQLAKALGLRMPHASLACKQLREQGLVRRDEAHGLRNAAYTLTTQGRARLDADALSKISGRFNEIPRHRTGVVLQVEGDDVLIGYVFPPASALTFIPEGRQESPAGSTGNKGGWWLHAPPDDVQWYDVATLDPTVSPVSVDAQGLDAYLKPQAVGVVRARLLYSTSTSSLVTDLWFSSSMPTQPPVFLNQGPVPLGTVEGTELEFRPPPSTWACLPNVTERGLLVQAYAPHALVLSDQIQRTVPRLPLDVIDAWLVRRHPRMSVARRALMLEDLVRIVGADEGSATALSRALVEDFGQVDWGVEVIEGSAIDTRSMRPQAVVAIMDRLMATGHRPFVVDWAFGNEAIATLTSALKHPGCWAVITRSASVSRPEQVDCAVVPDPVFGAFQVQVNDVQLTVRPRPQSAGRFRSVRFPASAEELRMATNAEGVRADGFTAVWPQEHREAFESALFVFPEGDEPLANRIEHRAPLAAWIASDPLARADRALRIAERLPPGWLELMAPDAMPVNRLIDVMDHASEPWRRRAVERFVHTIGHDPSMVLDVATAMSDPERRRWAALMVLCSPTLHGADHRSLFEQALEHWWSSPVLADAVLAGVFGHGQPVNGPVELEPWLVQAERSEGDALLKVWAGLVRRLQGQEPLTPSFQRRCMTVLPDRWWMSYASAWLRTQLDSSTGRSWLAEHPVPWTVLLARTPGERCGVPGAPHAHPGWNLRGDDLIPVRMLREGPGTGALVELLEMTLAHEQHAPVPVGASHPSAGWLVRPLDQWPTFTPEMLRVGCPRVAALLLARQYASNLTGQR